MKNPLIIYILSLLPCSVNAQIAGHWEGSAEVNGKALLIAFDISGAGAETFSATMDVPAQGAKGLVCDEVRVVGDSVFIAIKMIQGRYAGKFDAGRTSTSGVLKQGKVLNTPLDLKRTGEVVATVAPVRPQNPKPPFPYKSVDVEYDNPDKTVHLGATLTVPSGAGPFPAAILISGSGLQDRDADVFDHKLFLVVADYLTRRGIAVLRVDDRNAGKSTGPAKATSADYALDAGVSLDFLKTRKDIDPKKIGLVGHSEGGMIAPMVAAARPDDVAFVVSLAGPGEPALDLMEQQNVANLKSMGSAAPVAEGYGEIMKIIMRAASTESDTTQAYRKAAEALLTWRDKTNPGVAVNYKNIIVDSGTSSFVKSTVNSFRNPWMKYFLTYDPTENLAGIICPVLALNGGKDIQVLAEPNLAGWEAAGKGKDFTVKELPGLNHLFQQCKKCTLAEYGELTETFSPEALQIMGDWLVKKVLN